MSALVTRVSKSRTKFPKIEKIFYRPAPTGPRTPGSRIKKSSSFQRRSRDEDDLRKKNSTIGEPRRKRNIYPSGLGTPPESSLTF